MIAAVQSEFAGIQERLAAIAKIDDPELAAKKLAAALATALADLDKLEANLHHDPAVAGAIYKIICSGLGNGLAGTKAEIGKPESRNPTEAASPLEAGDAPGHEFHGNQHTGGEGESTEMVKSVMNGKADEAVYAKVSPEVAAKIKTATGQDVSGYSHFIDHDALTHIHQQHGVGREDQAGHQAITQDDIEKIPAIVSNPDTKKGVKKGVNP